MKKIISAALAAIAMLAGLDAQAVTANIYGVNSVRLVEISGVPVSVTGQTTEKVLMAFNMPGGTMGPNGCLRITYRFSYTNNANTKGINVKLGGVPLFSKARTTQSMDNGEIMLCNRGVENSQLELTSMSACGQPWSGSATCAMSTYTIDTSKDQLLTITGTPTVTSDTITAEASTVEVMHP